MVFMHVVYHPLLMLNPFGRSIVPIFRLKPVYFAKTANITNAGGGNAIKLKVVCINISSGLRIKRKVAFSLFTVAAYYAGIANHGNAGVSLAIVFITIKHTQTYF